MWIVVIAVGLGLMVIGGILPANQISGRFAYRLAWGFDGFPLVQHLLQASRWLLTLALPVLPSRR